MRYRKKLPQHRIEITNGGIYLQMVRCGKKNCRCAAGKKHKAYYFFTREGRTLTKTYIRKSELEKLRQLVNEAKGWRRMLRRCRVNSINALAMAKIEAVPRKDRGKWNQERFDYWVENIQSGNHMRVLRERLYDLLEEIYRD